MIYVVSTQYVIELSNNLVPQSHMPLLDQMSQMASLSHKNKDIRTMNAGIVRNQL